MHPANQPDLNIILSNEIVTLMMIKEQAPSDPSLLTFICKVCLRLPSRKRWDEWVDPCSSRQLASRRHHLSSARTA
jgi:hypothetical protein